MYRSVVTELGWVFEEVDGATVTKADAHAGADVADKETTARIAVPVVIVNLEWRILRLLVVVVSGILKSGFIEVVLWLF